MTNISLRVDDALLEEIDEERSDDVSRSKWLRRAAREKIDRPAPSDELADLRDDLDDLDDRVTALEDASLLDRIFKAR